MRDIAILVLLVTLAVLTLVVLSEQRTQSLPLIRASAIGPRSGADVVRAMPAQSPQLPRKRGAQIMIGHLAALLNPRYAFRSAITGKFVSRFYALLHPNETVRERLP